jgi:SAM-dependent methyltransferase
LAERARLSGRAEVVGGADAAGAGRDIGEGRRSRQGEALWVAFAELVLAGDAGPVADLGCGPGYLTAHLRALGLDAFGLDLSPVMVELARREHPGIRFQVGSMDALDLADGTVGGILSWYSIIHAPAAEVPGYFAEFGRVLTAGG